MEEPDWATVLQAIYRSDNGAIFWPREDDTIDSTIEETDLSQEEEDDAISYLHNIGLIEHADRDRGRPRRLTQKGFDIAHERELRNQQETHNRILSAFTVLVGISALVQAVSVVSTESGPMQWILGFISVTGALAFVYVLKGKAEIFTE
ncbi:hypothetical protein [Halolamina salifodinae]|uniref:Uncharacterized protein n=1 Tax=Halolamina salifodinae TaxID=1202767 RepID=A0A8T4GXY9_9EURY|nr:hypothetical protein [Halolamina salifodinae]MBP1986205.1 hypothetical protein [Halolamina salifodinae]